MKAKIKAFLTEHLPYEILKQFRWYRKQIGGFWVNSCVMGWQRRPKWIIDNDLNCFKHSPELYNFGRDIENYPCKE